MKSPSSMSAGNWFTNRPIRHQVVGFLLVYLILIGSLGFILWRLAAAPQAEIAALSQADRVAHGADALTIALLDGQASFVRYLTTGAPADWEQFAAQQAAYRSHLAAIQREVASSPALAERWQRLESLAESLRRETVDPGIALRQAIDAGTASSDDLARFAADPLHLRHVSEIRDAIDELATDEREISLQHASSIPPLMRQLQWIYLSSAAILALFGILVAVHIESDIAAPIQRMTRMARAIADGNLGHRIGWTRTDEIGQMANTFDEVVGRLETTIEAQERVLRDAQQKEAVQAAMLNGSTEGLALISPDYRILTVNQRLSGLLGVDLTTFQGLHVRSLLPIAHRILVDPDRAIAEATALFLAADDERTVEFRQHFPVVRELHGYSTAVRSSTGENLGRLVAVRDVTRERQSDQMKSDFVSMVSHELRTPLTSIKGYVDLLRDGELGELTDDQLGFLNIVAGSTDRLIALINDLLDISSVESGKLQLNLQLLDVAARIDAVVSALRPRLNAKGHHLTVSLSAEPLLIMGDANRIDQILDNLLSNAIKYTPDGGAIGITAAPHDGTLQISVADSGFGIAEEEQQQLFTRFYRSHNPAVRQAGGTGLGLAITRSLVELHGGAISVSSRLGAGSTFSVKLPRVSDGRLANWAAGLGQASHTILLVLDAPEVAQLLAELLGSSGHTVHLTDSAAEAMTLAQAVVPALILVSDHLPDVDPLEVVQQFRADQALDGASIILLSYAATRAPAGSASTSDGAGSPTSSIVDDRVLPILEFKGGFTIVLGMDNPTARRLVAGLYRRVGYRVIEAPGGVAAVEALLSNDVQIALINSRTSDAEQFELARSLRANVRTRDVPVIAFVTGADAPGASQVLIEALGSMVLKRPLTGDDLVTLINPVLSPSHSD